MVLSKRRLQFLDELVGMYQRQRLPIHYEALANAVGVSKWTAYDMLKAIEKSGYVTRSYEVNPNETGRSQVVFAPTQKATELFEQQRPHEGTIEKWEESMKALWEMIHSLKHTSIQDLMKKMLDDIPQRQSSLEFCGYILGILIVYLKKVGGRTEAAIRRVINKTTGYSTSLLMFVGTVMGTVIQSVGEEISNELAELLSSYVKMIGSLSNEEHKLLADFVNEALA
ncbi:Lrp/AsnC family transcriptional regulator [Paenibacillus sp. SYP-B4298]|uniref:Lrp/AsnC family transcriptional regulator n=1 Tax=Paenibacillus sp. SYP-B4298 TaxID=2996034 RepID=UPI0022DD37E3|nr:Lrp/AsnC family transcriptional regulator [Paenibacillus sp. SYP-B4298]